jgi:hypothetical protein
MTKLNRGSRLVTQPMATEKTPTGRTHQGAVGYERDERTELFLRATTVFAGEGQFYEKAKTADARAIELIRKLAVEDWEWVAGFLPWLRSQGNIRTSAIMLAAEAAQARAEAGCHGYMSKPFMYPVTLTTRQVVDAVMQRGDEPTEMTQYCLRTWGKIPVAVKRGTADAMIRLWRERAVIRYDKPDRPMRFADAIELVHPDPLKVKAPADLVRTHERYLDWDSREAAAHYEHGHAEHLNTLFKYLLDERHGHEGDSSGLPMTRARKALSGLSPKERHAFAAVALDHPESDQAWTIKRASAGQWEWVMSWLGEGTKSAKGWSPLTERQRWELVLPEMGYMALIRNLRNFEQAGMKEEQVRAVCDRIADPKEVARSRQFPYRFLSAHLNTKGAQWLGALEAAVYHSTGNVPSLDGMTHILVDCSGSMDWLTDNDKKRQAELLVAGKTPPVYATRAQQALLFAFALAARNPGKTEIFLFAIQSFGPIHVYQGASILRAVTEAQQQGRRLGGGTHLEQNLRLTFDPKKHTRSVILTDDQAAPHGRIDAAWMIPEETPLFAWNVAGYTHGAIQYGPNRVGLGGLTDASFTLMQRYESSKTGLWPWQVTPPVVQDDDEDE